MSELIAYLAALIIVGGTVFGFRSCSCTNTAEAMGRTGKFGITTGCMVSEKGHFIPLKNLRAIGD